MAAWIAQAVQTLATGWTVRSSTPVLARFSRPIQPPMQWVRVPFPAGKTAGR